MAIAGKVAITPKGDWNANTTYEKLDLVFYENASYVATKPSTGVLPTDESYWMLVVQSAGGADLDAIISGATQVGNAKTLDGHEAEYFMPLNGHSTKNGNLNLSSDGESSRYLTIKNAHRSLSLIVSANGKAELYDDTNGLSVLSFPLDKNETRTFNGTASGNLPLSGGTINGYVNVKRASANIVEFENTDFFQSYAMFKGTNGVCGGLGFNNVNKPIFINDARNAVYDLLHTGNKPTGTYTGNGSEEQRTIATGGIGNVCVIRSNAGFNIVYSTGAITFTASSYSWDGNLKFNNGTITMASTSARYNESGRTYEYDVL